MVIPLSWAEIYRVPERTALGPEALIAVILNDLKSPEPVLPGTQLMVEVLPTLLAISTRGPLGALKNRPSRPSLMRTTSPPANKLPMNWAAPSDESKANPAVATVSGDDRSRGSDPSQIDEITSPRTTMPLNSALPSPEIRHPDVPEMKLAERRIDNAESDKIISCA